MVVDPLNGHWVVDTGPLSHFARAGWFGILQLIAPDGVIWIPDTVEREILQARSSNAWLEPIVEFDWVRVLPIQTDAELAAFSRYARLLVGDDGRNIGECGVLALAEVHGMVSVVDDQAGHKAAVRCGVDNRRTLGLLCDAVEAGHVTLATVSIVADALCDSEYRLPFQRGGFERWAIANGRLQSS